MEPTQFISFSETSSRPRAPRASLEQSLSGMQSPVKSSSPSPAPSTWIQPGLTTSTTTSTRMSAQIRSRMSQLISREMPADAPASQTGAALSSQTLGAVLRPSTVSPVAQALIGLKNQFLQELESQLPKLLALNPSRREAVAQYLDRMAGHAAAPGATQGGSDPAGGLRRWIEGPRSPAQNLALRSYFEEVALVTLGQAVLLKAWSERGIRLMSETDLGRLNWALSQALKPHVPLDREGWQVTRASIYSWYNPSPMLQHEAWKTLESWRVSDEGPALLGTLSSVARSSRPEVPLPQGYDSRFFDSIWSQIQAFGFDASAEQGPLRRSRVCFSPTLRDGAMVRTGPTNLQWVGLEESAFHLMLAEMIQLWWGPASPPLWSTGTGLEVHTRDQLALALGSARPSLQSRIAEMEACDLGFVLEDRMLRAQGRGPEAQRLRDLLEQLPYFKKLRTGTTTLGDLQAAVALSKLRPGGMLWWAREEPLSGSDGQELLGFLLEKGRLVCEWDLSGIDHHLPSQVPAFPRFLYLFAREPRMEERVSNRPWRVQLQGSLRSHVEVGPLLEDALRATVASLAGKPAPAARGSWAIHAFASPTPQKDWAERWPDPAAQGALLQLERLRADSLPLAQVTTIRHSPEGDPSNDHRWSVDVSLKGFWVRAEGQGTSRRLVAEPLPRPGSMTSGAGFLVLLPDESWHAPLSAWLGSEPIRQWLEHRAERRGDRWVLNDQTVKWIPVPKSLLRALGSSNASAGTGVAPGFATPLPGDWERIAAAIDYKPSIARDALARLDHDASGRELRAALYIRASRALDKLRSGNQQFQSVVTHDGRIRWREILKILPKSECVAVPFHSGVRISGTLPSHLAIGGIERVRMPSPGILFSTEQGFSLHVGIEQPMLLDMLWDQLEGLVHPTWNELLAYLKLPRRADLAEDTASEILKSHGEHSSRARDLQELLEACLPT